MSFAALTPPRTLSQAWRPRLPDEAPLKKDKEGRSYLSPSAIDTYLGSPLKYLLQYGLGMGDRYEEKKELGFNDYGTFIHRVLELFASEQKEKPLSREAEIGASRIRKSLVSRSRSRMWMSGSRALWIGLTTACSKMVVRNSASSITRRGMK